MLENLRDLEIALFEKSTILEGFLNDFVLLNTDHL